MRKKSRSIRSGVTTIVLISILVSMSVLSLQTRADADIQFYSSTGPLEIHFLASSEFLLVSREEVGSLRKNSNRNYFVGSKLIVYASLQPYYESIEDWVNRTDEPDCKASVNIDLYRNGNKIENFDASLVYNSQEESSTTFREEFTLIGLGKYSATIVSSAMCLQEDGEYENFKSSSKHQIGSVVYRISPDNLAIKRVSCGPLFMSVSSNSKGNCLVEIDDKDHAADSITMNFGSNNPLVNFVQSKRNKNWTKTSTGWLVRLSIPINMLSPNQMNNFRKAETFEAYVTALDEKIDVRFTDFAFAQVGNFKFFFKKR